MKLVIGVFFLILFVKCSPRDENFDEVVNVPDVTIALDEPYGVLEEQIYAVDGVPYSGYLKNKPQNFPKFLFGMIDGRQHGPQKGWHSNGNVSYAYACIHGKRHGLYSEFYPSGKKQILINYDRGAEIEKTIWDVNGKVIVNYVTKDGRYYGLMGSSQCMTIFNDEKTKATLKE